MKAKARGYTVRVEENRIAVEHRDPYGSQTILVVCIGYIGFCFLPEFRGAFSAFYHSPDVMTGAGVLLFLTLPLLFSWAWFFFKSGEVMICDARELQYAQRRFWGRWGKQRFDSKQIQQLQKVIRGNSKSRSYLVLTFEYSRQTYDMLEELSPAQAEQILQACKSFGLDALIPHDPGAAMLQDIEERGWFVNPLKPD